MEREACSPQTQTIFLKREKQAHGKITILYSDIILPVEALGTALQIRLSWLISKYRVVSNPGQRIQVLLGTRNQDHLASAATNFRFSGGPEDMTSHPEVFPKPVFSFPSFCTSAGGKKKSLQSYSEITASWQFRVNSGLVSLCPASVT